LVAYGYDRWWPTLFASVSDDTDPWRGGEIRTREVNAGTLFTVRARPDGRRRALTALNLSTTPSPVMCAPTVRHRMSSSAAQFGWAEFRECKSYGYSVTRESGTAVRVTWENAPEALGSDAYRARSRSTTRAYGSTRSASCSHRGSIAGASSWDTSMRAASSAPQVRTRPRLFFDLAKRCRLLRGFDSDTVIGSRAAVANLDYRFPVRYIQRGSGTISIVPSHDPFGGFCRCRQRVERHLPLERCPYFRGAELSVDTVIGFGLPLSFSAGVAWRHAPVGTQDGVAVFGRIGRAF
jgi:hypothetical protein